MAQHNYFGFTAPVTQYAPQASAYAAAQPAYVPAGQAYATATAAAVRAPAQYTAFESAGHAAYAYTPAPPVPRPTVVTVAVTPQYQAVQVKPAYSSGYGTSTARTVTNVAVAAAPKTATNYGYVTNAAQQPAYSTPQPAVSSYTNTAGASVTQSANAAGSSYDAALYSAATSYYNQKQNVGNVGATWVKKETPNAFANRKPVISSRGGFIAFGGGFRKKAPNLNPVQSLYCEVCKISCAGPQTYKEHLEGQKHKKKEAQQKAGSTPANMRSGQSQLRCDLCDVSCTGTDAYTAHIRGAKHQKTVNLHQRLGKPIPSTDPTIVTAEDGKTTEIKANKSAVVAKKAVVGNPGIKFVTGSSALRTLASVGDGKDDKPVVAATAAANAAAADVEDDLLLPGEKAIQPVGNEYIEETFDTSGKLVTFFCKLCDCKFNDPNAKNMHMKGRRHRTNYKKKVDPNLVVEMKANTKIKRLQADRDRVRNIREMQRRQREEDMAAVSEIRMLEQDRFFQQPSGFSENYSDRIETFNDRHIIAKHTTIYPSETELMAIQEIVTACEKSLKLVSDVLHEESGPAKKDGDGKEIRQMKGVMRVGDLAKGLLLSSNLNIELVVVCREKPTRALLTKVHQVLPSKLKEVSEDAFTVTISFKEATVVVTSTTMPATRCALLLTSPLMRDNPDVVAAPAPAADGAAATPAAAAAAAPAPAEQTSTSAVANTADLLDKQKCLDALAALRHAKWFQARASVIPSCVLLLRVLKELRSREEKFACIPQWAMELLLQRCMSTAVSSMGPGDALRRFFESISSGLILPGGAGLSDPCEKEPINTFAALNVQSRENLTAYSQTCLRLIAFNKINKILDIDVLAPEDKPLAIAATRKRPFNSTDEDGGADGKKEKTDEPAAQEAKPNA